MILGSAFNEYLANFKTALAFGLLLAFVALPSFLSNTFIGSGSIFLEYNLFNFPISSIILELLIALLLLGFFSLFITLTIFGVRRDLSVVKLHYSLPEQMQKFAAKIFAFYALLAVILFVAANALIWVGVPLLVVNFGILIVTISLIFVPQAIVVDEDEIDEALISNYEFIEKNLKSFAMVIVVATVLLALSQLLEFAADNISIGGTLLFGRYISLILMLIFIVPFVEVLKTYIYMFKYDLIKHHEMMKHKRRN